MTIPINPSAGRETATNLGTPTGPIPQPDQETPDTQAVLVGLDTQISQQAGSAVTPVCSSPAGPNSIVDPLLYVHVTTHGDLEQLRIASENRLRILTATEPDEDGVVRGFGLSDRHPDVARLAGMVDALRSLEHDAELILGRAFRRSAIHPWVKAQCGLGDKQVARLVGAIGDPYWHLAEDRPRTVSELWAYCGLHVLPADHASSDTHTSRVGGAQLPADQPHHDTQSRVVGGNQTSDPDHLRFDALTPAVGVAARRRRGQKANWSTEAKTRAYLIATSCIKQEKSPYRAVYLTRRERTATTHPEWTPGHSHNDALRIASKAILRDLWREARRLHGHTEEQQTAA